MTTNNFEASSLLSLPSPKFCFQKLELNTQDHPPWIEDGSFSKVSRKVLIRELKRELEEKRAQDDKSKDVYPLWGFFGSLVLRIVISRSQFLSLYETWDFWVFSFVKLTSNTTFSQFLIRLFSKRKFCSHNFKHFPKSFVFWKKKRNCRQRWANQRSPATNRQAQRATRSERKSRW